MKSPMREHIKHPDANFYGRRVGRPLNQSRQEVLDTLLPKLGVRVSELKCDESITAADLFPGKSFKQHWLEIGFGTGEHLFALLQRHTDFGWIGVEPFMNGMGAFLKDVSTLESVPQNLRVYMDDAVVLAQSLSIDTLDGIYILNPDPWHKARHHKRRIVRPETLDIYARILKPGGQLVMSTDVPYLAEWMVTHAANHPAFHWSAKSAADWLTPPGDWVHTAYETKRAKGADKMVYLFFERK